MEWPRAWFNITQLKTACLTYVKAFFCMAVRRILDPCVVQEDVQRSVLLLELFGKIPDAPELPFKPPVSMKTYQ